MHAPTMSLFALRIANVLKSKFENPPKNKKIKKIKKIFKTMQPMPKNVVYIGVGHFGRTEEICKTDKS